MSAGSLKIFFTFLVLGPISSLLSLVASLFLLIALGYPSAGRGSGSSVGGILNNFWPKLVEGLSVFVLLGGLQAAFIGLVSAIWYCRRNKLPLLIPLAAAIPAFAVFLAFMEGQYWYGKVFIDPESWRGFWNELQYPLLYLLLHATMAFWPWMFLKGMKWTGNDSHHP